MLHILWCQYHSCWCPGDLRSQGIIRHGINLQNLDYSISGIKIVNMIIFLRNTLVFTCEGEVFGNSYDFHLMYVTVKPVCNDHLSNKIHYLWFIQ